jgi:hypothetical protein
VGDEFIYLQLALHIIIDWARELSAAFNSTESTSL